VRLQYIDATMAEELKRQCPVRIMLSKRELEALKKAAEATGLSASIYARVVVLAAARRGEIVVTDARAA
jgi:hypothetical protein